MPPDDKIIYMDARPGSGIKLAFFNPDGEIEHVQHNEEGDGYSFFNGGSHMLNSVEEMLCSFVVRVKSGEVVHFVVYQPEDEDSYQDDTDGT